MSLNAPTVLIEADDRERNAGVIPLLEQMEGAEVTIVRLEAGDYRIDDRLLFERKTMPDFALSIVDGRFFRQMMRLAAPSCRGVLILEGTFDHLADSGMRREALQGALITAGVVLGVPVLYARDTAETARLMVTAARQVRWSVRGAVQRPLRRTGGCRWDRRQNRRQHPLGGERGAGGVGRGAGRKEHGAGCGGQGVWISGLGTLTDDP
jgi:ERCC4-type nuclease